MGGGGRSLGQWRHVLARLFSGSSLMLFCSLAASIGWLVGTRT